MLHRLPVQIALAVIFIVIFHSLHETSAVDPGGESPRGMRVLIVEETGDRSKLPAEQLDILTSSEVRDYVNTHCAKDASGAAEFRDFDKDVDASHDEPLWQDGLAKAKTMTLPVIFITGGGPLQKPYGGPLPKSVPDTMALLKKYGGE